MIGAAGRRRAVHHRRCAECPAADMRAMLAKRAPAVDEDLGLVVEIGAAALDQRDDRAACCASAISCTRSFLLRPMGAMAPPLMPESLAVTTQRTPLTEADAGNHAAALDVLRAVVVVHVEAGERRQLEERRAAVEHLREALARQ